MAAAKKTASKAEAAPANTDDGTVIVTARVPREAHVELKILALRRGEKIGETLGVAIMAFVESQ